MKTLQQNEVIFIKKPTFINLTIWGVIVLIALVPLVVLSIAGGLIWGVLAFFSWCLFARVLWVRRGLADDVTKLGGLNDVKEASIRLRGMLTPYEIIPSMLRMPVFLGLAEFATGKRQPLHLPPELIRKNHISYLGASGTGKTKLTALTLTQMLTAGDAVCVFDPKDDQYLPGILCSKARDLGRPVVYINLRADAPQINPFRGASRDQREQLLQAGLQLDPTGNPSVDFHRAEDRDACSSLMANELGNILDLVSTGATLKSVVNRTNFWRELRDLARLQAFHTAEGPDLAETIEKGGVVYIVGDIDSLRVVAAQRLLLARLLQIIKDRERDGARQVSLFLDEFKYMLSNSALRALGTIRDRNCNLLLAYQSYGDLEDCGTLPPKAVLGAAKGNTTLKFVFKLEDGNTAKEFSAIAGENAIVVESIGKTLDDEGLETGQWRASNKAAVTVDMLTTAMPKPLDGQASVCWVFGLGPAFPLSTMHLPAGHRPAIVLAKALPALADDQLDGQAAIGLESHAVIRNISNKAKAQDLI